MSPPQPPTGRRGSTNAKQGGGASPANAEEGSSSSSRQRVPLDQVVKTKEEMRSSTPETALRPRQGVASSSSTSKSQRERTASLWDERDRRTDHQSGTRGSRALFSPPVYKTGQFSHSTRRDQAPPPSTPATMDQGAGREFDQLDLNEDFHGPGDPLMLGSFGEESPPRLPQGGPSPSGDRELHSEQKRRRSPPGNPYAYQQSYSGSGAPYRKPEREGFRPAPYLGGTRGPSFGNPYSSYAPHASPLTGYISGPRSSPQDFPGYSPYPYHRDQYWDPPMGHAHPTSYDHEDDIPPPSSSKKRPPPSSFTSPEGTPEKPSKARSPFRSPPTSRQKYKRIHDFQASPHFGTYGSFGMDTPNATLGPGEFSPMGPSLQEFDENAPLALVGHLGISRSNSHDSATPIIHRLTTKDDSSPLTGFMNALSPFDGLHGIARSPMVNYGYEEPSSQSRGPKPVTASGARDVEPRLPSTPHGSVKKALWPRSEKSASGTPGRLRLEIGSTGALSTRKSLEGINSMIHSRPQGARESDTKVGHEGFSRVPPPQLRGQPLPHPGAFHGDLATPIKSSGHGYHSRPTPSSIQRPFPGSASQYQQHPPTQKDYPGSASKPRFGPPATIRVSDGKENKKNPKSVPPKRTPCNCKKSRCLKLYCECFAGELFCQDCNCSDCGNTPTSGAIRDKAIKDTRAKNPNAFKPRFNANNAPRGVVESPDAGHNLGCRCKKSECLKKYCECFQAGTICGDRCKCVDCQNYAGSQALIDKRRKIKDQRGADFAMRVADEAWRQGQIGGPPRMPAAEARRPPSKSSPMGHMPPPHMMHSTPRRHPPPGHGGPPHAGPPPPGHGGPPYAGPPPPGHGGPPYAGPPPPGHGGPPQGPPPPGHGGPPHEGPPQPGHGGPPHEGPPQPGHGGPPHGGPHGHPHHLAYHPMAPYMRGPPYPHMGMPVTPAGYPHHMHGESPHIMYLPHHHGPPASSAPRQSDLHRPTPPSVPPKNVTPVATTPKTPGIRVLFDPASSRKKRKIALGQVEATIPFFGLAFPAQPKTTALAIFSFLSNDDLYNAGLVCKSWSQLAMDGELWKF